MEGILYLLQQLKAMVTPIGISDIIDILIMAFIIYKLIMLIRRTSSGAVAKGVLLFLVALWISSFGLNTVNFLLGKLVEWGGVALVVIFQPEIRRFLEQMGRTSLSGMFTHEEERNELDSAITQTVEAYASLSKSKTGALMVFERKNQLPAIALKRVGEPIGGTVAESSGGRQFEYPERLPVQRETPPGIIRGGIPDAQLIFAILRHREPPGKFMPFVVPMRKTLPVRR